MASVLIVEDNVITAELLKEALTDAGYHVCGVASNFSEAITLGLHFQPELAIIDMRLDGRGLGTDVALELSAFNRVGLLYTTDSPAEVLAKAAHGDACLAKPYRLDDLLHSLEIVASLVAYGKAARPFPPGFYVLNPGTVSHWPALRGQSSIAG